MPSLQPLIGVTADRKRDGLHQSHSAGEKYLTAVIEAARGLPMVIPALAGQYPWSALLAKLDGLLLTGGVSNIEPQHYGQVSTETDPLRDPCRDHSNLALIPAAIDAGLPILGICRGLQELNVALGGSLHQQLHRVDGLMDHREDLAQGVDVQYAPAHTVTLVEGGLLARISDRREAEVNSLHGQGIARLAEGLVVEATAPDGLVEAVSLPAAAGFVMAVQWHPEWQVMSNPFYLKLFSAFGDACRQRAAGRGSR
ncbi:MAG TPA: gamma-glutamyl-gamma-aminobutyrate hydrolase family protein [Spongiibacteraceae bacterium]|jgi:putative glutamine amidotransferase|nr:gamma-glutamyl-gamma-aminobutyrate hydrolase family protein [Spongiibacteraceae bacterium]HUH36594.1 gamma-glutamyl-gamma-aminobutyrate hydrolase family protein [Spongiibacteraceae bacterium]